MREAKSGGLLYDERPKTEPHRVWCTVQWPTNVVCDADLNMATLSSRGRRGEAGWGPSDREASLRSTLGPVAFTFAPTSDRNLLRLGTDALPSTGAPTQQLLSKELIDQTDVLSLSLQDKVMKRTSDGLGGVSSAVCH